MTSRRERRSPGAAEELVEAYLADLEHALSGLDPGERDEVVASVHEHIDTALNEYDGSPTSDEVEALLRQLGSVDQIARDAGDGADRSNTSADTTGSHDGWVPVTLAAASLLIFWFPIAAIGLALGAGVAAAIGMRGAPRPAKRRYRIAITLSVVTILIGLVLGLLLLVG